MPEETQPPASPDVASGRVPQPRGRRGSLKWIQTAVNRRSDLLEAPILAALGGATGIDWRSPLRDDGFAEYRDAAFLERLGLGGLAGELAGFWPARGPQWDALGRSDRGDVLLVEAKAHLDELCSPPSQAGPSSLARIEAALAETAAHLGARNPGLWPTMFYQLANRLAHLYFLRRQGIAAWLVLVNFIGDADTGGPQTAAEWQAAYRIVFHVLGLPPRHRLDGCILELYPDVRVLEDAEWPS